MTRLTVRAGAAVAGAALAAGLLTGCATSGDNTSASAATHDRPSAQDVVAAAYDKTVQTGSAKLTVSVWTSGAGASADDPTVSGSGEVDFANRDAEMTLQLPNGMGQAQVRYIGGTVYAKVPGPVSGMLGGGKAWLSVDVDQVTQQQFGTALSQLQSSLSSNPADLLGYLRGTGQDVRELGPATIDGVATTRYAATFDLDKAVAGQPEQVRAAVHRAMKQIDATQIPAQLWVDQQGRLRKLLMSMTMHRPAGAGAQAGSASSPGTLTQRVVTTLSDYGVPVNVIAPPADRTQDVTGLISGAH